MKYEVIGWTYYEDYRFKDKPMTFASRHAIIDEIKEHGYRFSGYEHQESPYGCPVLNDGTRVLCSQRGFAGIMAEAYGEGAGAYARYMMTMDKSFIIKPEYGVDKSKIVDKDMLIDEYYLDVSDDVFQVVEKSGVLEIEDLDKFRYIDKGDALVLNSGTKSQKFKVIDVDRKKALTQEQQQFARLPHETIEEIRACNEMLNKAKVLIIIKLKRNEVRL